jgi:hypothetical protein
MKNIKKLVIGNIYKVEYIDHYATTDKSIAGAVRSGELYLIGYGKLIGINRKYIVLCNNYDDKEDNNNDCLHILKGGIKTIVELIENITFK